MLAQSPKAEGPTAETKVAEVAQAAAPADLSLRLGVGVVAGMAAIVVAEKKRVAELEEQVVQLSAQGGGAPQTLASLPPRGGVPGVDGAALQAAQAALAQARAQQSKAEALAMQADAALQAAVGELEETRLAKAQAELQQQQFVATAKERILALKQQVGSGGGGDAAARAMHTADEAAKAFEQLTPS